MAYMENESWKEFYEELNADRRVELYEKLSAELPDDGANALRKKLLDWRYNDPKRPDKTVDKGIWEMIVMTAHLHGVVVRSGAVKKQLQQTLNNIFITEETRNDEVLSSAIYWELRNTAKRFYDTCDSPKYGRKFFGMMDSSKEEKLARLAGDVHTMAEGVPVKFQMEEEFKIFTDALTHEFYAISPKAKTIYYEAKYKAAGKKLPFII